MSKFLEINALNEIYIAHNVEIKFSTSEFLLGNKDYPKVAFILGDSNYQFYVEDEYYDRKYNYPLLNLCLVLRELEHINETPEYSIWCKEHYLEPTLESVILHYENLKTVCSKVKTILGEVKSYVSDWDFEMGSGAAWELRKS